MTGSSEHACMQTNRLLRMLKKLAAESVLGHTSQTFKKLSKIFSIRRPKNIHGQEGVFADELVSIRIAKYKTLTMPTLILPSIQVNIRVG